MRFIGNVSKHFPKRFCPFLNPLLPSRVYRDTGQGKQQGTSCWHRVTSAPHVLKGQQFSHSGTATHRKKNHPSSPLSKLSDKIVTRLERCFYSSHPVVQGVASPPSQRDGRESWGRIQQTPDPSNYPANTLLEVRYAVGT